MSNRNNVAIVQDGFVREDPLSTLKVVTTQPIPKAGAGEVVVHITMRPIHPMDFIFLRGSADFIFHRGSGVNNGTPGAEGFGTVHEVCNSPSTQFLSWLPTSHCISHGKIKCPTYQVSTPVINYFNCCVPTEFCTFCLFPYCTWDFARIVSIDCLHVSMICAVSISSG